MRKSSILAIIFGAALTVCCTQEYAEPDTPRPPVPGDGDRVEVAVDFRSPSEELVSVKGSILEGAETVHSGATVYAYLVKGGTTVIDDIVTVPGTEVTGPGHSASAPTVKLSLRRNGTYNIYVVGNAWYVNKSTGTKANWSDVMGADMPMDFNSGLKTAVHRFDGSDFRNGYRHEKMAEVKTYGLPYSGSKTGITVTGTGTISIDNCRFLFAKVSLTVDHTGLDGNHDANYFKNTSVSVKQANGALSVFAASNKLTTSSAAVTADGDPSMTNAHKETYTFYVPENMQGNLLSTNSPALKNLDNPSLSSSRGLLTYLEFKGTVNPSNAYAAQIGYTGDFTYRFCLGTDNCKNFDVVGGHCYDITLNFTVNSLFNPEAEWKVSSDSFSDGRVVDVMKFTDCAEALGASQPVIVRANRPGKVFLYVNKEGVATGGTNVAKGRNLVTSVASYTPSDVTDCAVCISPALSSLSEYGITAAYTASDASLSFSVTNMSKFSSWLSSGQEVKLTATLLPSKDNAKKREFVLKPFADLVVSGDFNEFYVAMKRTVTCSGFYGSNVRLYNSSEKAGSPNIKYVKGSTRVQIGNASHPYTIEGGVNGSFDVVSCRETDSSNQCTLCVSSDDEFNDGIKSVDVTVKRPWPAVKSPSDGCNLYVHGDHCKMDFSYYTTELCKTKIEVSKFDRTEYNELLLPTTVFKDTNSGSVFKESVRILLGDDNLDKPELFVYSVPQTYVTTNSYPGTTEWVIPYFSSGGGSGPTLPGKIMSDAVIPAFDKTARYSSTPVSRMDDYTPFPDRPSEQTFWIPETYTYSYGTAAVTDIQFDIVPRTVGVGENGALTASLTNVNNGKVWYTIKRGIPGTPHSLGYHTVKPYTKNINSGQVIRSHHDAVAKVTVHNVLAGKLVGIVVSAPVFYRVDDYQIPNYHYIYDVIATIAYDCGTADFHASEQIYTGGFTSINYPGYLVTQGNTERLEGTRSGGGYDYLDISQGVDPNAWPVAPGDSGYFNVPWGQCPAGDRSWVMDNYSPSVSVYYLNEARQQRPLDDKEIEIEAWRDTLSDGTTKRNYLFLKWIAGWVDKL